MTTVHRTRHGRFSNCRGQALVEFAVAIICLLMLVFGIIEIARIMLCYTTVANAARIGARYAIVNGSPPGSTTNNCSTMQSNVTTIVKGYAAAGTLNTTSSYLTVTVPCTSTTIGTPVSVTVSYKYDPLLTYYPLGTINLSSTSEGVITW